MKKAFNFIFLFLKYTKHTIDYILQTMKIIFDLINAFLVMLKRLFIIWCLCWAFYYVGGFKKFQNLAFTFEGYIDKIHFITKQKACEYLDCKIKHCNESVCVY